MEANLTNRILGCYFCLVARYSPEVSTLGDLVSRGHENIAIPEFTCDNLYDHCGSNENFLVVVTEKKNDEQSQKIAYDTW